MELIFSIILLTLGLGILILGAQWLVKGASSIARRFGISPLVVGLTVVSFGTSAPELAVNMYSALTGATDLAIGNIIGSNIANILLILGITAMIAPLAVKSSTVRWEIPFALLAAVLAYVMGRDVLFDGASLDVITRTDGFVLIGFFAVFMYYVFELSRKEIVSNIEGEKTEGEVVNPIFATLLIFAGIGGLVLGGKLLVDSAIVLAQLFGLSEAVIGLTVVAIGTSLPELATSVVAVIKKEIDIAVGNVVGSNIFNLFWILGATSIVAPLPVPASFGIDALVMILATLGLFLALFVGNRHQLDRWQGAVFVLVYVGYLTYLIV